MKLMELLEGWYDPPEYPDSSGESYYDSDLNDEKDLFKLILWDKETDLFIVQHETTNKKYIGHTDGIDRKFYMADTYTETDYDEDGRYSYETIDEDNLELVEGSITMYSTVAHQNEDVGVDYDEFESGIALIEFSSIILRGFYLNDKPTFDRLTNSIRKQNEKKVKYEK